MDRKILVFTTSYPLDGGIMASSFVAQHCENLVKHGYEISLLCPHHAGQKQKARINNVDITRFKYFFPTKLQKVAYGSGIPTNLRNSFLGILQLPLFFFSFLYNGILLSKNYNVIYAHWTVSASVAILIKKLVPNKKVFFMNHGVEIFVLGKNFLGRKAIRFILKQSDQIISNSTYTCSKTKEIWNSKNHSVISPGVNIQKFFPANLTIKFKYDLLQDTFVLFSLGNCIERKGFEYLIKAMNIIVNQRDIMNIHALIGGRGPLLAKYKKMIADFNLGKYITLVGYISQEELPAYFNSCDVFVHPAIIDSKNDTEGLGVVLSEANACGKPVIASRVGGIVDVIKDRYNGLLVHEKNEQELADVILELKNNPKLLRYLESNARPHVLENFTWGKNVEKTISLINNLTYESI